MPHDAHAAASPAAGQAGTATSPPADDVHMRKDQARPGPDGAADGAAAGGSRGLGGAKQQRGSGTQQQAGTSQQPAGHVAARTPEEDSELVIALRMEQMARAQLLALMQGGAEGDRGTEVP